MRTPDIERDHPAGMGGVQRLWRFANGLGASVIKTPYSYGSDRGLWEMAMIRYPNRSDNFALVNFALVHDSPLFPDTVEGHLTDAEVDARLAAIEALPQEARP